MYSKKNRAFSLIEVIVAVAIIAILSGLVVPQLRQQIAKSKDTKAVSVLNSFRVASQMYQLEEDKTLIDSDINESTINVALEKLKPYLDKNASKIIEKNGVIEIGGSRDVIENTNKMSAVVYGGKVKLSFRNSDNVNDGAEIYLTPIEGTKDYDTKGNKWIDY